jgi:TonB family protein
MKKIAFIFLFFSAPCWAESKPATVDRAKISVVVKAHRKEISTCYEDALKVDSKLKGTVKLLWDVNDKGEVANARAAENDTGSKSLADCVIASVRTWKFTPAPQASLIEIDWPFQFTAKK